MLRIGIIISVLVSLFGFGHLAYAQDQLRDRDRQYDTTPQHDQDPDRDRGQLHVQDPATAKTTDLQIKDAGDRDRTHDRMKDRDRIHTPSGSATRQGGRR